MSSSVILQIIVTGIVAIVPSKDPNVTRLIAPNHMEMSDGHKMVPNHFAYLDVRRSNCRSCPRPDFTFYPANDNGREHLVYVLKSQRVSFGKLPSNGGIL